MAKEYLLINDSTDSKGMIAISTHVLETIAAYAVEEESGVHLADNSPFRKAVACRISNNELYISLQIKLDYGKNVATACENAQTHVKQTIAQMADIPTKDVSIDVIGFVF